MFPDQRAWYATLGYRLGEFMPYLTYAELDSGADANPFALQQTSTTLGLRYELTTSADLKLEVEQVDPDRGNFGLFDQAVEDATLVMFALDVIF